MKWNLFNNNRNFINFNIPFKLIVVEWSSKPNIYTIYHDKHQWTIITSINEIKRKIKKENYNCNAIICSSKAFKIFYDLPYYKNFLEAPHYFDIPNLKYKGTIRKNYVFVNKYLPKNKIFFAYINERKVEMKGYIQITRKDNEQKIFSNYVNIKHSERNPY